MACPFKDTPEGIASRKVRVDELAERYDVDDSDTSKRANDTKLRSIYQVGSFARRLNERFEDRTDFSREKMERMISAASRHEIRQCVTDIRAFADFLHEYADTIDYSFTDNT
jgi:hypothetical protein